METTFIDFLINYGKEGIFFVLFVVLFVKQYKDSEIREGKLYEQLHKSNEQLDKSIEALQDLKMLNEKIDKLTDKIKE